MYIIYIMAESNPSSIQALKDKIKFYEDLKAGGNMNMRGEQILHELRAKLAEEEGGGGAGGGGCTTAYSKGTCWGLCWVNNEGA